MGYKVKVFVVGRVEDNINGKILEYPIIPRIGDIIHAEYAPDEKHPLTKEIKALEVSGVSLLQEGEDEISAFVYVIPDEVV
ncbi:hypothetical protein [Carnobacterium maltaromaticum]|uniref:hypothetical protein n=1 Tax=Carnobacterium maltaromaticum TaxID=2751 RepID=UPI001C4E1A0A|nr:hypothetical protein [Carnobacterium maltaromaticum]